jgi:hypothetical protein
MNAQNIKLTEEETAIVYRCRQNELIWETWGRYGTLFTGIIYLFIGLFDFLNDKKLHNGIIFITTTDVSIFAQAYAASFFIFLAGIFGIVLTLYYWNGNPNHKLLLKLADRITNQEKSSSVSQSP